MSQTKRQFYLLAVLVTMVFPWSVGAADMPKSAPLTPEAVRVSGGEGEETIERPVVVATTDIHDAQVVLQDGNEITVLFNLYNAVGVQSGVVYGVELFKSGPAGRQQIDVTVYNDQPLTLGVGETLPVSVTYQAPAFLSGEHELWVMAKTQSGMPLSLAKVGDVSFVGVGGQVALSDCAAEVGGNKYALAAGVDIAAHEALSVTCMANNTFSVPKEVSPQLFTYERSVYGSLVETSGGSLQSVTLLPNSPTKVTFVIPTATKAQAYDAVLQLVDVTGAVVSSKVVTHYVVQGESATLQNAVFDRSSYAAGETAEVMVTWSLAADAFQGARGAGTEVGPLTMSVVMADAAGQFCSAPAVLSLQGAGLSSRLAVPVLRDCADPHLVVGLTNVSGVALADQSFAYAPVVSNEELEAPASATSELALAGLMIVLFVVLTLVAVKLLSYARTRVPAPKHLYEPKMTTEKSGVTLVGVVFLFTVAGGLFLGVQVTSVAAATLNVTSGFDTVTFTVNTNKATYTVGEQVQVFGAAFVTGCGNAITDGGLEAVDGQGVTQTVGVFNMDPFNNPGGFAMFDKNVAGYSSPGAKLMPIRGYVEVSNVVNSALGNLSLTVVCPIGSVWDGVSCVSNSPQPSATVTGGGCTIAEGDSTCVSPISWNIENATVPSVRNVTTNTLYSFATTGIDEYRTIVYGVNVVAAYDATTTLKTAPVIGSCQSGTSWNGAVCAADPDPSASISVTSCEITEGNATCGITMDWNIQAATTPNVYNDTTNAPLAAVATGNSVPLTIAYGSHVIQARDGVAVLDSATANATCDTGLTWDGAVCTAPMGGESITLTLTANGDDTTTSITEGDDVYLEWEVTGDADTCIATDDWGGSKSTSYGTEWAMNVSADSTYTLTCTGIAGSVTEVVTVHTKTPANLLPIGLSLSPSTIFDTTTGTYDSLFVQYSVRNDGDTNAGAFLNRIRLDRGADGSYEESVNDSIDGGLAASAETPLSPLLLASNVPFGTHRVYIKADVLDAVDEGDETDNEDSFLLTVPVPNPHLEVTADPALLRSGESTVISWNTQVTFPMDCIVRGPKLSYDFDPSTNGAADSRMVSGVTAKSEYLLRCTEPTSGTVFTDSVWVQVIPTVQEI